MVRPTYDRPLLDYCIYLPKTSKVIDPYPVVILQGAVHSVPNGWMDGRINELILAHMIRQPPASRL